MGEACIIVLHDGLLVPVLLSTWLYHDMKLCIYRTFGLLVRLMLSIFLGGLQTGLLDRHSLQSRRKRLP